MRQRLREAWAYRELLRNLVVRDLKVRYRNSFFGFLWALGNPLLMMGVFTIVFTVLWPQDVHNFPVFILAGLLPWNFFSSSVMGSITSITGNAPPDQEGLFPARGAAGVDRAVQRWSTSAWRWWRLFVVIVLFRVPLTVWLLAAAAGHSRAGDLHAGRGLLPLSDQRVLPRHRSDHGCCDHGAVLHDAGVLPDRAAAAELCRFRHRRCPCSG